MKKPQVSVIIPTYNYGGFIKRAIRSVLRQTFEDFELIVVDDGSTDHTEAIVKSIPDRRIKYLRHTKNRGGNAARNTGLRAASGSYLAFLDSDDEWLPDKLDLQIKLFAESNEKIGLIYSGVNVIDQTGNSPPLKLFPKARGNIFTLLLKGNCITGGGSSDVIKKECFENVGFFNETLPSGQEWDFHIRVSKIYAVDFIDECLVNYYVHSANTASKPERIIRGYELILSAHHNDYVKYPSIYALQCYELGIRCCNYGFMKRGRSHFYRAFRYATLVDTAIKTKSIIQITLSFTGSSLYSAIKKKSSSLLLC